MRPQTAEGWLSLMRNDDFDAMCAEVVPLMRKLQPAQPMPATRAQLASAGLFHFDFLVIIIIKIGLNL